MIDADRREPAPAEAYFSLLLERARLAGQEGNYAIAAALALRHRTGELVVLGQNTIKIDRDPVGHAEMNAIQRMQRLVSAGPTREAVVEEGVRGGWLRFRRNSAETPDRCVLYATLEPCPMCTVALLNAGVDRVVIATPDPLAGALAPERLSQLPPLWQEIAQRLEVAWTQSDDPVDSTRYLSSALQAALLEAFESSRAGLDEQLVANGVLDRRALGEVIQARFTAQAVP